MIFSISAKIQDGGKNSKKFKHLRGPTGVVLSTLGVQHLSEIALSLTVLEINGIFYSCKNSRWQP